MLAPVNPTGLLAPTAHSGHALRQQAEVIAGKNSVVLAENLAAMSIEAVQQLLHELCVHQIELEMQNEELRRTQLELESSHARYFDFYDMAPVGYCTVSLQGLFLQANLTAGALLGLDRDALVNQPITRFIHQEDQDIYYLMRQKLVNGSRAPQSLELRMMKGNTFFWVYLMAIAVQDDTGAPVLRLVLANITERKQIEADIHRLAYYDPLTRLPNRRLLYDRLGQALAATGRSGLYGAIFFIDLDSFKALNDTRGHDVGDLLLVEVARRLRAVVREGDTVARQGGDEFVVLLESLDADLDTAAALAKQLGDKLRASIDPPFLLNGFEYHCRLSIGVGLFHEQCTVESLLKQADLALYQAKSAGRNTLRFFNSSLQIALDLRNALEAELHQALQLNQLRLYYQPQVNGARRVIGVEALLRWQHPQRGLVSPVEFIPLAEETGLILPMGLWVLETACAQLKAWEKDAHTRELQMAVNVSARQFRQADFLTQVARALDASGANPAVLKLELTESLVLENVEDTIEKMHAIKHLGVNFSMDDFGTGYSSLSYLAQLPIDQLKIDKSFVNNLPGKSKDETIARTIFTLGQGLGMDVIAEGVETEAQHEFLALHGCTAYQGYLFSRPLPIEALTLFLQAA